MIQPTPLFSPAEPHANVVLERGSAGDAVLQPAGRRANTNLEAKPAVQGEASGRARWLRGDGRAWKVAAVIPCFNRPQDVQLLLQDLSRQRLGVERSGGGGEAIELWAVIVDNASSTVLSTAVVTPAGLKVEHVRNTKNAGGAGGFNLGMRQVLSGAGLTGELGRPDFIWWIDSDARVSRDCLRELVRALAPRPKLAAVGSALCDTVTRQMWELGGTVIRKNGQIVMARSGDTDRRVLTGADYLAACSALVRREAIEATGLMPENFIYFDDVEWCVQCRAKTGLRVKGVPRSKAYHPPANRRFMTWGRYYISRNAFSHMNVMRMGGWKRFRRGMIEMPRAVAQTLMGMDDLAELHMRGLRDALRDFHEPIEPKDLLKPLGAKGYKELAAVIREEMIAQGGSRLYVHPIIRQPMPGFEALRAQVPSLMSEYNSNWAGDWKMWRKRNLQSLVVRDLVGAAWRGLTGTTADVAIVPTGWPSCWFRGRTLIQITTDGFYVRRVDRIGAIGRAAKVAVTGMRLALSLLFNKPRTNDLPKAPEWRPAGAGSGLVAARDTGAAR